jgi:hypothetical protein
MEDCGNASISGSYAKIEEIDLSKGQLLRDFGQGFYVTKFYHQAETWAKRIGEKYGTKGFVTEFVYFDSPLTTYPATSRTTRGMQIMEMKSKKIANIEVFPPDAILAQLLKEKNKK